MTSKTEPTTAEAATEAEKPTNGGVETPSEPDFGPNVHLSRHPVLSHKISILRSSSTSPASFRSVLREITFHLGYEATSSLSTKPVPLSVPVGHDHIECTGQKIADRVALIPILRSGLGMVDSMLELLPDAGVHHIGMYRRDMMPVQYYNRLPRKCECDVAYVLDPVVASGSTVMSVCSQLKKWGVPKIYVLSVIASRSGLAKLIKTHPDIVVSVGTVDDKLNDDGMCIPGLGDAGDRLFGTPMIDDEEELLHPSKRKRTMSDVA
uniref:uracil phosphoribosyltransferase n=1 Tax=Odontella aurita TaxID=265563 RepID=A0A7S4JLL4_9STRA|mmetsp:Transcript_4900/g.13948  ORF Transcript_4900/g.13948 Transcript_4900/m.13948 type:complete len:265 (+) Transcript_4900:79-873(+)